MHLINRFRVVYSSQNALLYTEQTECLLDQVFVNLLILSQVTGGHSSCVFQGRCMVEVSIQCAYFSDISRLILKKGIVWLSVVRQTKYSADSQSNGSSQHFKLSHVCLLAVQVCMNWCAILRRMQEIGLLFSPVSNGM